MSQINEEFSFQMHKFFMEFMQSMHAIQPDEEILDLMTSEKGLSLINAVSNFYCEILDENDIRWIIDNNLNGKGLEIINKLMDNLPLFQARIIPLMQNIEQEF